jgi:hypothetical protein
LGASAVELYYISKITWIRNYCHSYLEKDFGSDDTISVKMYKRRKRQTSEDNGFGSWVKLNKCYRLGQINVMVALLWLFAGRCVAKAAVQLLISQSPPSSGPMSQYYGSSGSVDSSQLPWYFFLFWKLLLIIQIMIYIKHLFLFMIYLTILPVSYTM